MARQLIDYAALRQEASMLTVVEALGITLEGRGDQRRAHCPFHHDSRPSLQVNLAKKVFHCFGCQAKGNVLDLVQKMRDCPLPEAAEQLAAMCGIDVPRINGAATVPEPAAKSGNGADRHSGPSSRPHASQRPKSAAREDTSEEQPINPPLSFELSLSPVPDDVLAARSISRDVANTFGIGVATRGLMQGRLAIPLHDEAGHLVGYCGRWLGDDADRPADEPKYLLPPKLVESRLVYNLSRLVTWDEADRETVVIVEGYFATMRLHALGVPVVSVMGTSIADDQIRLLSAELDPKRIILLMDGDAQGKQAAEESVLSRLARLHFVLNATARLDHDEQPDDMSDDRLLSYTAVF